MSDYIKYLRNFVGENKVIMIAAGVFIFDSCNRILLQLRADNKTWGHPGGFMELGETVEDTVKRETLEETGLRLGKLDFFGVYSGPNHENTLSNGDQVALVKMMFTCREYEGVLEKWNNESIKLEYFTLDNLPENIFRSQRYEFNDLLSGNKPPFIN